MKFLVWIQPDKNDLLSMPLRLPFHAALKITKAHLTSIARNVLLHIDFYLFIIVSTAPLALQWGVEKGKGTQNTTALWRRKNNIEVGKTQHCST